MITKATADKVIKGNFFERIVATVSPQIGARRMNNRIYMALAGSYLGGDTSRRQTRSWGARSGDADSSTLSDLPTLRTRSRDAARNQPIALGAVNTVCTNVVGSGLKPNPSIDAEVLGLNEEEATAKETILKREFALWAESQFADASCTQNFYGLQDLALRSALEAGDVFAVMPFIERPFTPYRLAVNMIEAERVSNPFNKADTATLVAGVEKDVNGAPFKYWMSDHHPGSRTVAYKDRNWRDIPAFGLETGRRNVIHLFTRLRPGQTRGVPYLAPVIEPLKVLDKFTESELMAAAISSMFTVFVKSETLEGFDATTQLGTETGATTSDEDTKLASGLITRLKPGQDVEFANPMRPNTAFDPFVQAILRQIGVALEIPFELLIKHFTSSYTAARAAMLDAWKFFQKRRTWLAQNFCQPIYENWMDEAVSIGRISAPGYFRDPIIRKAYLGARWSGPGRGMINEKEEVTAIDLRVNKVGLTTLEQETLEYNGGDWQGNYRQRVREKALRVEGGLEEPVGIAATPQETPADTPAPPNTLDDDSDLETSDTGGSGK